MPSTVPPVSTADIANQSQNAFLDYCCGLTILLCLVFQSQNVASWSPLDAPAPSETIISCKKNKVAGLMGINVQTVLNFFFTWQLSGLPVKFGFLIWLPIVDGTYLF